MKKSFLIAGALFAMLATSVSAQNLITNIGDQFVNIFTFGWLTSDAERLGAVLRGLLWLGVFGVILGAGKALGAAGGKIFAGPAGMALAAVIATMSAIALPTDFLFTLSEGYATAFALLIVLFPALIGYWILYRFLPGEPMHMEGRMLHLTRLIFLLLFLYYVTVLTGAPGVAGLFMAGLIPKRLLQTKKGQNPGLLAPAFVDAMQVLQLVTIIAGGHAVFKLIRGDGNSSSSSATPSTPPAPSTTTTPPSPPPSTPSAAPPPSPTPVTPTTPTPSATPPGAPIPTGPGGAGGPGATSGGASTGGTAPINVNVYGSPVNNSPTFNNNPSQNYTVENKDAAGAATAAAAAAREAQRSNEILNNILRALENPNSGLTEEKLRPMLEKVIEDIAQNHNVFSTFTGFENKMEGIEKALAQLMTESAAREGEQAQRDKKTESDLAAQGKILDEMSGRFDHLATEITRLAEEQRNLAGEVKETNTQVADFCSQIVQIGATLIDYQEQVENWIKESKNLIADESLKNSGVQRQILEKVRSIGPEMVTNRRILMDEMAKLCRENKSVIMAAIDESKKSLTNLIKLRTAHQSLRERLSEEIVDMPDWIGSEGPHIGNIRSGIAEGEAGAAEEIVREQALIEYLQRCAGAIDGFLDDPNVNLAEREHNLSRNTVVYTTLDDVRAMDELEKNLQREDIARIFAGVVKMAQDYPSNESQQLVEYWTVTTRNLQDAARYLTRTISQQEGRITQIREDLERRMKRTKSEDKILEDGKEFQLEALRKMHGLSNLIRQKESDILNAREVVNEEVRNLGSGPIRENNRMIINKSLEEIKNLNEQIVALYTRLIRETKKIPIQNRNIMQRMNQLADNHASKGQFENINRIYIQLLEKESKLTKLIEKAEEENKVMGEMSLNEYNSNQKKRRIKGGKRGQHQDVRGLNADLEKVRREIAKINNQADEGLGSQPTRYTLATPPGDFDQATSVKARDFRQFVGKGLPPNYVDPRLAARNALNETIKAAEAKYAPRPYLKSPPRESKWTDPKMRRFYEAQETTKGYNKINRKKNRGRREPRIS